jgi:hypothetical protein
MALSNISKNHLNELIKSENNQIISNHNHLSILKGNSSSLAKMTILIRQLNFIKDEMNSVLEEANLNNILNNIETRFKKYPGNTYHLYKKNTDDSLYLSLLSPNEFNPYNNYLGSYTLKEDHIWEMAFS